MSRVNTRVRSLEAEVRDLAFRIVYVLKRLKKEGCKKEKWDNNYLEKAKELLADAKSAVKHTSTKQGKISGSLIEFGLERFSKGVFVLQALYELFPELFKGSGSHPEKKLSNFFTSQEKNIEKLIKGKAILLEEIEVPLKLFGKLEEMMKEATYTPPDKVTVEGLSKSERKMK